MSCSRCTLPRSPRCFETVTGLPETAAYAVSSYIHALLMDVRPLCLPELLSVLVRQTSGLFRRLKTFNFSDFRTRNTAIVIIPIPLTTSNFFTFGTFRTSSCNTSVMFSSCSLQSPPRAVPSFSRHRRLPQHRQTTYRILFMLSDTLESKQSTNVEFGWMPHSMLLRSGPSRTQPPSICIDSSGR